MSYYPDGCTQEALDRALGDDEYEPEPEDEDETPLDEDDEP